MLCVSVQLIVRNPVNLMRLEICVTVMLMLSSFLCKVTFSYDNNQAGGVRECCRRLCATDVEVS